MTNQTVRGIVQPKRNLQYCTSIWLDEPRNTIKMLSEYSVTAPRLKPETFMSKSANYLTTNFNSQPNININTEKSSMFVSRCVQRFILSEYWVLIALHRFNVLYYYLGKHNNNNNNSK
jgi:hypothetical protein